MCKQKPRKVFIETLINNSLSKEFDSAMFEWVGIGKLESNELGFKPHCELCGAAIYNENYIIYNVKTKKKLQIGSECMKRFRSSHNNYKNKHPQNFFRLRKWHAVEKRKRKLIDLYHLICNQGIPEPDAFQDFSKHLISLLKISNKLSLLNTSSGAARVLTTVLEKTDYSPKEVLRLQLLLDSPDAARKIYIRASRKPRKKVDKYGIVMG
ncbi:hypothetical protein FZC78_22620 [Rossellomorea vietnamensis]|uniref:Uncharacterized protein n=1 Tax=Rossellomorea vietnamensis TaxID=218284 RepID=A0A5D4NHH5_9BACI|nr:hypothetical protein [Rossellomorea vietnamensis]TYS12981.1 hypothetical protein FZC78_22620 [Rossellomorea vietnamensis]